MFVLFKSTFFNEKYIFSVDLNQKNRRPNLYANIKQIEYAYIFTIQLCITYKLSTWKFEENVHAVLVNATYF